MIFPRFSVNMQNLKNSCYCGSPPSYKENGLSWGSHFAWRDDERVKSPQIRGHRGITLGKKITAMPDRCVAANCHNVVVLSKCIVVHKIPFLGN